jgi:hypothetical protein
LNEELSSLDPDKRKDLIDKARQIISIDKCYDIFLVNINPVYAASERLNWVAQPGTPYLVGLNRARWK